ncbi:MAG TPA: fused MFS/spermidine synthase, partial [Steroidobacteraceae bacterium]|nr:fused MFS/spermidine synthase [Steroidobacteraceae bacterium]
GYIAWALLISACAVAGHVYTASSASPSQATVPAARSAADMPPGIADYLRWAALSALGSWLLVALTNHLTRDVAAIPLLWILPLAVYLLSFVIGFGEHVRLSRRLLLLSGTVALIIYAAFAAYGAWPGADDNDLPIAVQVAGLTLVLAGTCLLCNGALALTRPAPRHLTRFYLTLAFGGALGAVLIGLAAPVVFNVDFDLEIGMGACTALVLVQCRGERRWLWLPAGLAALATLAGAGLTARQFYDGTVLTARNFYGTLRVFDWDTGPSGIARSLAHGVIVHGTQYRSPALAHRPTEYYGPASGVGHAMAALQRDAHPLRIGVIGLGTGTMAAYGRPGDVVRFYEINPAVIDIAQRQFSFLRDSRARIELARGDARLTLAAERPQHFDLLVVDAFSGDAIPVHLLTREALEVYVRHMRPGGLIAFHLSNLYLDLVPVVQRLAQAGQLAARLIEADDDDDFNSPSTWVLVSTDPAALAAPQIAAVARRIPPNQTRLWTDDFSDLLRFLH